jgi:hypothetical protein
MFQKQCTKVLRFQGAAPTYILKLVRGSEKSYKAASPEFWIQLLLFRDLAGLEALLVLVLILGVTAWNSCTSLISRTDNFEL